MASAMDWMEWSYFFSEQSAELHEYSAVGLKAILHPRGDDWSDTFYKLNEAHRKEIEAAIRLFIKTGKWPKLTEEAGILLEERLLFASDYADQIHFIGKEWRLGPPKARRSRAKIIEWFLIDSWDEYGMRVFTERLEIVPYPTDDKEFTVN